MSVHDIILGMLLALPGAMVAVVFVGSAMTTVRRWLESCQWC
ncbi:MAG TPA: hypothetical protein VLG48_01845 [Candidatus Methylomirabilis sp.]|nr:hypothetical protein [Candidatus Methylomirabilis sp.]